MHAVGGGKTYLLGNVILASLKQVGELRIIHFET